MNSLRRRWAITQKALRQLARDRLTFGAVAVMIPVGGKSMNSLRRLWAITQKELRQLARDRLTFGAVAVMIPVGGN
ncbi:hypothetical protein ACEUCL_15325 [Aeromonas dhakensis]|uniref:hypothetical protein n=1 Tax=Aeromonas dhakensis TaxID=196024 RepID=UPI0038D0BF44